MVNLSLVFVIFLMLSGCEELTNQTPPTFIPSTSGSTVTSGTAQPGEPIKKYIDVAWKDLPEAHVWNKYLDDAMINIPDNANIKTPCKVLPLKPCAKQLLSIIAKRESSFKPEKKYEESGHLEGVTSRGLFQISKDSANLSAYKCNITDAKQLHDPNTNIKCAVKILAYQAKKTGTLIDGAKTGGCGVYWSVCRSKDGTSKSYKAIMDYMSKY